MKFRLLPWILLLSFVPALFAQSSDRSSILQAAREIMTSVRFCSLVTIDKGGLPQIRIMDPFPPTETFTVWMATHSKTRKTKQIQNNPKVAINYFDKDGVSSVTIIGRASLTTNLEKRKTLWKDEWKSFYSDTYKGDDYVLIEIQPISIEVISHKHKIASEPNSWRPAILNFP